MKTTEMDKTKLETTSLEQGMGKWVKMSIIDPCYKLENGTDFGAQSGGPQGDWGHKIDRNL